MIKNERQLTAAFHLYLRKKKPLPEFLKRSYAVEFKWLKKSRLNFNSDLRPQQIPSLLQVKHECFYSKISDMSLGAKGFDAFNLCVSDAWLAVGYYDKNCKGNFIYFLDIDFVGKYSKKHKSISLYEIVFNSKQTISLG